MESADMQEHPEPAQGFSLAERDRRWTLVRGLMNDAGIDILLAMTEPDSRYLSQLTGRVGPTILPLRGEATTLTKRANLEPLTSPWIHDLRPRRLSWRDGIIERLAELDADRTIVGIVGLDGSRDWPDGNLNYGTFVGLREAFPHARWVGATTLVQEARYRKSREEVRCIERAAQAADAGLAAAAQHMTRSTGAQDLLGPVLLAVAQAGADPGSTTRFYLADTTAPTPAAAGPVGGDPQRSQILLAQVEGRVRGYGARGAQPVAIGLIPRDWADAWRVTLDVWRQAMALLRPGASLGAVVHDAEAVNRGPSRVSLIIRGAGLGDDLPVVSARSPVDGRVLEEGVCFALLSRTAWGDPANERTLTWGDTVVITRSGARRLGSRPQEFLAR